MLRDLKRRAAVPAFRRMTSGGGRVTGDVAAIAADVGHGESSSQLAHAASCDDGTQPPRNARIRAPAPNCASRLPRWERTPPIAGSAAHREDACWSRRIIRTALSPPMPPLASSSSPGAASAHTTTGGRTAPEIAGAARKLAGVAESTRGAITSREDEVAAHGPAGSARLGSGAAIRRRLLPSRRAPSRARRHALRRDGSQSAARSWPSSGRWTRPSASDTCRPHPCKSQTLRWPRHLPSVCLPDEPFTRIWAASLSPLPQRRYGQP